MERFAVPKIQKNGENGEILSPEKEEWLLGDSRIDPQYWIRGKAMLTIKVGFLSLYGMLNFGYKIIFINNNIC